MCLSSTFAFQVPSPKTHSHPYFLFLSKKFIEEHKIIDRFYFYLPFLLTNIAILFFREKEKIGKAKKGGCGGGGRD